jgi:hypothetical protein
MICFHETGRGPLAGGRTPKMSMGAEAEPGVRWGVIVEHSSFSCFDINLHWSGRDKLVERFLGCQVDISADGGGQRSDRDSAEERGVVVWIGVDPGWRVAAPPQLYLTSRSCHSIPCRPPAVSGPLAATPQEKQCRRIDSGRQRRVGILVRQSAQMERSRLRSGRVGSTWPEIFYDQGADSRRRLKALALTQRW